MGDGANVQSIEALTMFRAALCKFVEAARSSLGEAEADLQRHAFWLSEDRRQHWKSEIRRRDEQQRQAKMALLAKKLQSSGSGGRLSCVDEEKAYALAQRRFEEAQAKLAHTTRWMRLLDEKIFEYKGMLQAFNHSLDVDVVNGLAWLDRMIEALEAYVALAPPSEVSAAGSEFSSANRSSESPGMGSIPACSDEPSAPADTPADAQELTDTQPAEPQQPDGEDAR